MRYASGNAFSFMDKICALVVLLCFLHISVVLVYYIRNADSSQTLKTTNLQNHQIHRKLTEQGVTTEETKPPSVSNDTETERKLETCPDNPPNLVGPLRIEFSDLVTLDLVREQNPALQPGGRFKPQDCIAQQKVAMIIPFRNRDEHLKFWLYYMHPILQNQQLDYGIYIIIQDGDDAFNRAKLLNIGYAEALKEYDYQCFVFSDVDLIPMDDRNIYKCFSQPRHLSVSMDKFGFRLPYATFFGGVSSLSKEQYLNINGFPNNYWGWGGEDDDIFNRISIKGMSISRPDGMIGRCRMIRHGRDKLNDPNPQRFDQIAHTRQTMGQDGISSLSYKILNVEKDQLFTKITVDVGKP
ncbi:beta-1,4-galactosyltransferase 1-like [Xyrauchen texanus]|uniref:beta-1,4-galactosyltransferase 1-like n=1 Tax=Xyrauchen texanus TaxID=154827 RepID=UPI0022421884|nr:beta-1,4-galactosyltransferase 1-like [Xyrauchen texanus]